MGVNVIEATQDLVKNALDTLRIHAFVVSGFHQLVQVTVHVLHTNMQFSAVRVEEDIQGRNKVDVSR